MSIVVVVKKDNVAVIAADTLTKAGEMKLASHYFTGTKDKIFSFGDSRIGIVGAAVHMDVLRSICERHADEVCFDSRQDIFETYVRLHPILKDEYYLKTEDKDADYESSQIDALIANPKGIFGMYSWRTAAEYERFYAIGSGRDYAMGAMFAVYETETAERIAEIGVRAAAEYDDSSGWPMTSYRMIVASTSAKAAAAE